MSGEDDSNQSEPGDTAVLQERIKTLEKGNERLRRDVERLQEANENLHEKIQNYLEILSDRPGGVHPQAYELAKSGRSSEEIPANESEEHTDVQEIKRGERINRRHKRLLLIALSVIVTYNIISYIISNPPQGDFISEKRFVQLILIVETMFIVHFGLELCIDYRLDERIDLINIVVDQIENKAMPSWLIRGVTAIIMGLFIAYLWPMFEGLFL